MIPVSIIILTHDEERNIGACLDSVAAFSDVHVLDSGSTDRTVAMVTEWGIPVHVNAFRGFGQQRNWAIDHIPARHPWHFHLDADERLTPELTREIESAVAGEPNVGGYFVPSKLMFAGRWLRHAGGYPTYQVRLFHRDRLRFLDHGHGQREVTTFPLARLTQPYLHHAFSRGLDHWFCKHARYARLEAEQALRPEASPDGSLRSRDPVRRRRALKRLSSRVPCRYFVRLFYMLFFKLAVLDGPHGITYSHMLATYEAMMEVHLRLLRRSCSE
jgi:glycosyltransferase involved in cell wall biosynthesis